MVAEVDRSSNGGSNRDNSDFSCHDFKYNPNRCVTAEQLNVFNLLVHPVWVFDMEDLVIVWGNHAAVDLWNADSLEALRSRSFDDTSESTMVHLQELKAIFRRGEMVKDQWTVYPKGQAKTIMIHKSGIRIDPKSNKMFMLVEALPLVKDEIDNRSLRGVEIIRRLPMPVCQFNLKGEIMFENPMSLKLRGGISDANRSSSNTRQRADESKRTKEEDKQEEKEDENLDSSTPKTEEPPLCDFLRLFANLKVGERMLQQLLDGQQDVSVEAEQPSVNGGPNTWSAIQVRRSTDPVTGEPVILYNARDITEVLQAKKQQELNVKKSEFFAIMAHEIRTPLHQVTGFIDLLAQTSLTCEQKSFVRLLKASCGGLMTVINDVLDFSKLEEGRMKLEHIPLEPKAVVQGSIEAVRPLFEDKGLSLNLQWQQPLPFQILGDPNRLRQIMLNLLQNAGKFTSRGGVSVKVEQILLNQEKSQPRDDAPDCSSAQPPADSNKPETPPPLRTFLRLSVTDTGVGISQENINRIFIKYQQLDASVARTHGGTGLGLSICKSLVENMGGSISVESPGLGQGSTFWFSIPCEVPAENHLEQEELRQLSLETHKCQSSRSLVTAETCELQVLVAEDNLINQKLLAKMLQQMGHVPTLVENGKMAVELFEHSMPGHFDAILMDIQMPVMDGFEATKRLRSSEMLFAETVPIIALTASVIRGDFEELGFNDWMSKPVPMKELERKLHRLWQTKQQQKLLDNPPNQTNESRNEEEAPTEIDLGLPTNSQENQHNSASVDESKNNASTMSSRPQFSNPQSNLRPMLCPSQVEV